MYMLPLMAWLVVYVLSFALASVPLVWFTLVLLPIVFALYVWHVRTGW